MKINVKMDEEDSLKMKVRDDRMLGQVLCFILLNIWEVSEKVCLRIGNVRVLRHKS